MPEVFGIEWVTWGYIATVFGLLVLVEVVIIQSIRHYRKRGGEGSADNRFNPLRFL
jgi:hypothetical protein